MPPPIKLITRAEPRITVMIGTRTEPMITLPIEYLIVSRKAILESRSAPDAKCRYLIRATVTCNVFFITCMLHDMLARITRMKEVSITVPTAVAPPIPDTKKQEYKVLKMIERLIKVVFLAGGEAEVTDKTLVA